MPLLIDLQGTIATSIYEVRNVNRWDMWGTASKKDYPFPCVSPPAGFEVTPLINYVPAMYGGPFGFKNRFRVPPQETIDVTHKAGGIKCRVLWYSDWPSWLDLCIDIGGKTAAMIVVQKHDQHFVFIAGELGGVGRSFPQYEGAANLPTAIIRSSVGVDQSVTGFSSN